MQDQWGKNWHITHMPKTQLEYIMTDDGWHSEDRHAAMVELERRRDAYGTAESIADRLKKDGWTDTEIQRYLNCTEEVNPDLSEKVALNRMQIITAEVQARLSGTPDK